MINILTLSTLSTFPLLWLPDEEDVGLCWRSEEVDVGSDLGVLHGDDDATSEGEERRLT